MSKYSKHEKSNFINSFIVWYFDFGQTPVDDPHLELVWEDHFNNINPNIWLVQNNVDHYGQEVQVYTDRLNNTSLFSKCFNVFFSFLHRTHVIKKVLNFAIRPDYLPINSLDVGQSVFLRASEGVLINGVFTFPIGAELYIDVNACY